MDVCVIENGLNLATSFVLASFWLDPASYLAIFKVVLGLGAVIFVHELGHFLLAKACGVKCDKFYVGFDAFDIKIGDRVIVPRRLIHWTWGETEYGIGILPFGGYVKMLGQDDNPGNLEEEVRKSMKDGDASVSSALTPEGLVDRTKIDPRSYLAKSVPQRMAIISAGVIFNLIFAVVFAAFAFRSGVDYAPPNVGSVVGGGPAWEQNLAGAKFKRIGNKEVEGYFTYLDLAQEIVLQKADKPISVQVERPNGDIQSLEITPQVGLSREMKDLARFGVNQQVTTVVAAKPLEGSPAAAANPAIEPSDKIIRVDDVPVETRMELHEALIQRIDKTIEFVVEREGKDGEKSKRVSTKLSPNPMRDFGFSVGWEPIAALQQRSPAIEAGLQIGDEILMVNGKARGDLLTMEQRMIAVAREEGEVDLTIKRDGETMDVTIKPVIPSATSGIGPNLPIAIDSLGVAIPITRTIEIVEPNSPADSAGLKPSDELVSIEYLFSDEQKNDPAFQGFVKNPIKKLLDDEISWAEIHENLQRMKTGSKIQIEVKRGSELKKVTLSSVASDKHFLTFRGLLLKPAEAHYQSASWSDAFNNGCTQVWSDGTRVFRTFGKLVSGQISPTNLGGPGTIAVVATSEASRGTSPLLLFLTFLSANLAVVNFLPIPVLDGGHMLFLAYEGIFRRPVNEKTQALLTYAGLAMILALMVFVVCLDASRIYNLF